MKKIDPKTIVIIVLGFLLIAGGGFSGWNHDRQSTTIKKVLKQNREFEVRDSVRTVEINNIVLERDTIHSERDTLYLHINNNDEQTKANIARVDSFSDDELLRFFADRYPKD